MEVIQQQPRGFNAGNLHWSKVRNLYERFMNRRAAQPPSYCIDFGGTGWPSPDPMSPVAELDLTALDRQFDEPLFDGRPVWPDPAQLEQGILHNLSGVAGAEDMSLDTAASASATADERGMTTAEPGDDSREDRHPGGRRAGPKAAARPKARTRRQSCK